MVKVTGQRAGLPAQSEPYECAFVEIEDTTHPQYGAGWKWAFEVMKGEHRGRQVFRGTSNVPTQGNSAGKFLGMLEGEQPLGVGVERETDVYVGKSFQVTVEDTPGGTSTRVASFRPSDTPF